MLYVPTLDMYIPNQLDELEDGKVVTENTRLYNTPSTHPRREYHEGEPGTRLEIDPSTPHLYDPIFCWDYSTLDFLRETLNNLDPWRSLCDPNPILSSIFAKYEQCLKLNNRRFTLDKLNNILHNQDVRKYLLTLTYKLVMLTAIEKTSLNADNPFPSGETIEYIKRPLQVNLYDYYNTPFFLTARRKRNAQRNNIVATCTIEFTSTRPIWMPPKISNALVTGGIKEAFGITTHCRTPEEAIKLASALNVQLFKQSVASVVKPELRDLVYNKPFQI